MDNYVTIGDLNTYLWISWEDTLMEELNSIATAYINNYLKIVTLFASTTYDEIQEYNWSNEYILSQLNPSNLTKVNWVSVVWEVNFTWRLLTFATTPINIDTTFNKITLTYDYGFEDIGNDVKSVVYHIVGYLYATRKSSWIKEFTQGQISITYKDWEQIQALMDLGLTKYKKNTILC